MSALKLTRSANPTVAWATCSSCGVLQALHPGDGGQQVPPPDIGEQRTRSWSRWPSPAAAPRCAREPRTRTCPAAPPGWPPPTRPGGPSSARPRGSSARSCRSRGRRPRTMAATLPSASASTVVNAAASPTSGKPRARQSRRASSTVSPAMSATCSPVSSGTAPTIARWRSSGAVIELSRRSVGPRGAAPRSRRAAPARSGGCPAARPGRARWRRRPPGSRSRRCGRSGPSRRRRH